MDEFIYMLNIQNLYLCTRMLKAFAAILLFSFSVQCFEKGLIILSYFTNKAVFAINCENKFRPEMNCNGKCVLMKKLQAEEQKQAKNPELKLENKVDVFQAPAIDLPHVMETPILLQHHIVSCTEYSFNWHDDFFHPPAV